MMKPATMISQDEPVQILVQQYEDVHKHYVQRMEFLEKQVANLQKEGCAAMEIPSNRIIRYLIDTKKMPVNYDPSKHHIHVDIEDGIIFVCDGRHDARNSLIEILGKL